MVARTIWRRYQQKEQLHWLAIEALEVDAAVAHRDSADKVLNTGVLRVWHSHTPPDPGAPKILSLHDRLHDALQFACRNLACVNKRLRHFTNDAFFRVGFNVGMK